MDTVNLLVLGALVGTVIVLVLGLRSMKIGGEYDREHAEKFMWERVALQGVILALLVAAAVLMNL
jgi:Hypoxia induced protein conserved region